MKILALLVGLLSLFAFPTSVQAVCPVCTVAVIGGLGISRWLGIDDVVTGIWIGGLIVSSGLWMGDWLKKRTTKIPYPEIASVILMALMVIVPLFWSGLIALPGNTMWGIDKVLLGTVVGVIVFMLGVLVDKYLRTTNQGRVYIYYQKVIVPVLFLTISSFIMYLITL